MSQQDEQEIQEAENALATKGLNSADFDEALRLLRRRQDAKERVETERQNQFYGDAFNTIGEATAAKAPTDQVLITARFLRRFAEHVAKHTLQLKDTHDKPKDIVDHIPNVTSEEV